MSIEVTLDIFSGRENPHWILSSDQERELFYLLQRIETPTLRKPSGVLGRLGYRGFILRGSAESPHAGLRLLAHEGIVDFGQSRESRMADNRNLESWLLDTAPDDIPTVAKNHVADQLGHPRLNAADFFSAVAAASSLACPGCQAQDAPVYNPAAWNIPSVQPFNNCYNYANNQITNTFAQPGRAQGVFPANIDCSDYQAASLADGLVVSPNFTNPLASGQGWYVALVIWPGVDFHWYRQDNNGCWSHKPGHTAVTNVDNSGNAITDPQYCDRGVYTDFCVYMITTSTVHIN